MRGVRIEHRGHDGSLSFDLRDILNLLGEDVIRSLWRITRAECVGDEGAAVTAALQHASDTYALIPGAQLVQLADRNVRVTQGHLMGRFPEEDDFWIMIRTDDGRAYDVLCDREDVLAALRSRFTHVGVVPSSAFRELSAHPAALDERLCLVAAEDPDHVVAHSYNIVEDLDRSGAGLDAVRTILRFMEDHPDLDFGLPGPLVHFAERFSGAGYEQELFASLSRRPTMPTVSMLTRMINGAENIGDRAKLILLLEDLRNHPAADAYVKERLDFCLASFRR